MKSWEMAILRIKPDSANAKNLIQHFLRVARGVHKPQFTKHGYRRAAEVGDVSFSANRHVEAKSGTSYGNHLLEIRAKHNAHFNPINNPIYNSLRRQKLIQERTLAYAREVSCRPNTRTYIELVEMARCLDKTILPGCKLPFSREVDENNLAFYMGIYKDGRSDEWCRFLTEFGTSNAGEWRSTTGVNQPPLLWANGSHLTHNDVLGLGARVVIVGTVSGFLTRIEAAVLEEVMQAAKMHIPFGTQRLFRCLAMGRKEKDLGPALTFVFVTYFPGGTLRRMVANGKMKVNGKSGPIMTPMLKIVKKLFPEIPTGRNDDWSIEDVYGRRLAQGVERIMLGDHGPYVEFRKLDAKLHGGSESNAKFFKLYFSAEGKTRIYHQMRSVDSSAPPSGPFSIDNKRAGGYADYRPGFCYINLFECQLRNRAGVSTKPWQQKHEALTLWLQEFPLPVAPQKAPSHPPAQPRLGTSAHAKFDAVSPANRARSEAVANISTEVPTIKGATATTMLNTPPATCETNEVFEGYYS
jgi:hypothetical protein